MGEITVRFFASARLAAGCLETTLPCPMELMNQETFWQLLAVKFPAVAALRKTIRLAQNHEYVMPDTVFAAGDEIALIPPVSGG